MSGTLVFVYGTLKRGLSNHGWLRGQAFRDVATTLPQYRMYDLGGYPGMIEVGGQGEEIEGEIWEVDELGLKKLDVLEGVAEGEYAFESVALKAPWDGAAVRGYLYLRSVVGRKEVGSCWVE